jgi:hypothetical protein
VRRESLLLLQLSSSKGLHNTASTNMLAVFLCSTRKHLVAASEMSFTLTGQEGRCMFAKRDCNRASLRCGMSPHSNGSGFATVNSSAQG